MNFNPSFLFFSFLTPIAALANSIEITNPDFLDISLSIGKQSTSSNNGNFTWHYKPDANELTIKAGKNGEIRLIKKLKTSMQWDGKCKYDFLISKNYTWQLSSYPNNANNCLFDDNTVDPEQTQKVKYIIENKTDHWVVPAFSLDASEEYGPDSIDGYLEQNTSRTYTLNDAYWISIGVSENSFLSTAIYDPLKEKYIKCDSGQLVEGFKTFLYTEKGECVQMQSMHN